MISAGSVESSESLKEKSSLGWGNESQSLDGLGGGSGSSLDGNSGVGVSGGGVLQSFGGFVVGFVSNQKVVVSSERFS